MRQNNNNNNSNITNKNNNNDNNNKNNNNNNNNNARYTYADSGGWGVTPRAVREELDDLRGRCDIIVHQGLPTANELQA